MHYFRRVHRYLRQDVRARFFGYGQVLKRFRSLNLSSSRSLNFYGLFKRRIRRTSFDFFFMRGIDFIANSFFRKVRYIKRKLSVVTYKVYQ